MSSYYQISSVKLIFNVGTCNIQIIMAQMRSLPTYTYYVYWYDTRRLRKSVPNKEIFVDKF